MIMRAFGFAAYNPGWLAVENYRPAIHGLIMDRNARLLV